MARGQTPFKVNFVLTLLVFVGFAANVLVWFDVQYFNYLLRVPEDRPTDGDEPVTADIEELKRSILNVRVQRCQGEGASAGTGFVAKSGYVATAAHVVSENRVCDNPIQVVDYRGLEHDATLAGYSEADDLAVLSFGDTSLAALAFADSTSYEEADDVVPVGTIGFPLVGTASSSHDAAISGEGNISHFDSSRNLFITSGLNLNPGNSGGPIFLRTTWQVLGIAVMKIDVTVGEGLGIVVPSQRFESFFREKTGEEL